MMVKNLTAHDIDRQNALTKERFDKLKKQRRPSILKDRPMSNLIELMDWTKVHYTNYLLAKDAHEYKCYIHSKIIIDGSFMEFCDSVGAEIETLHLDSISSWKTDSGFEHFMAQGYFNIKYKDICFCHAALFHKGNQNEDEVSFFVIVHDDNFDKYIEFRNAFAEWQKSREREQLEIAVIGGDGIPYTRDVSWDDLFLPPDLKADIKNSVEGFIAAKDFYAKAKVPWKRGILLFGTPGCGKTSLIKTIIANYNFKPVTVQTGTSTNDDTLTEAFRYAQEQAPGLLYIEDLDTLLNTTVSLSHFLNLVDGVNTSSGVLVIATANDISKLKESVTDRPSRFDRKWEIPLPSKEMATLYLKKWFGKILKPADLKLIAEKCVKKKFSYAYLKELYLTSIFNAINKNRKEPLAEDINEAMKQVLHDKNMAEKMFQSSYEGEFGIE